MDRRTYLKGILGVGGALMLPAGVVALVGRSQTAPGLSAADALAAPGDLARFGGSTMGTSYSVSLDGMADATLQQAVADALADVDSRMSTYRSTSELMQLNNAPVGAWQTLSEETVDVIASAFETREASGGMFDPSVGALVNLWGFGAEGNTSSPPLGRDIAARLDGVGAFEVDPSSSRVRRGHASTRLDLSGIAKGRGVDRVAATLDAAGAENYLVEVGGELRARGQKADQSSWRVAIERPDSRRRAVFRVIELRNEAIATSGDYRNFFIAGGERYSHTIHPESGRPVTHELASVSVIADSTVEADAWSTAMMVMGPSAADAFARTHGIAAHFILKSGSHLDEQWTPAFEPYIAA